MDSNVDDLKARAVACGVPWRAVYHNKYNETELCVLVSAFGGSLPREYATPDRVDKMMREREIQEPARGPSMHDASARNGCDEVTSVGSDQWSGLGGLRSTHIVHDCI